jgi:PAS domain S-box-containing protein
MPQPHEPPLHWTLANLLVGLLYVACGWLALHLSIPPGFAAPLYPPAGVALAFVLVFGVRVLPAVAVAACVVNAFVTPDRGLTLAQWWIPVCIGLGAAAQAGVGHGLVKRWVRQPLELSDFRDVVVFYGVGGVLACGVSASVATLTLWTSGVFSAHSAPLFWATWWMGDTLGVLIATPMVLTLIGQPRGDWAPRRMPVGLSLLVALGLLAAAIVYAVRDDALHAKHAFNTDAARVQTAFDAALNEPWQAVRALAASYRLFGAEAAPGQRLDWTAVTHRDISRPWMRDASGLLFLAWAEPQVTAQVSAAGLSAPVDSMADAPLPLRFVETAVDASVSAFAQAQRWVPGVNLWALPGVRAAVEQSIQTDQAVLLFVPAGGQDPTSQIAVLMQAVRVGESSSTTIASQTALPLYGVVMAGFRLQDMLTRVTQAVPSSLHLCMAVPPGSVSVLTSPLGRCDAIRLGEMHAVFPLNWAPQVLQLRVSAQASEVQPGVHFGARALAVVGLLAVAMLGALLLTVTGRARRIQLAVGERTRELLQQIKEREATEAQLRESETRLTNIVNNLPLGVVYSNLQGEIKQVNTRFCDMLGYSAEELMRMNVLDYTHPEDAARDAEGVAQLLSDHVAVLSHRKQLLRQDGSRLWVQSTVSLLRDAQGQARRIVAAVEDITEHLRLADAERAREAAETANQAKSVFLSRMSHELRTPLNAMLGFAQLLEMDSRHPLPDAQRGWVAQIQKAGWHLLDMINDVMDLSRIESGNLRLQETTLDLFELLAGTLPLVEADARQRGVSISHHITPDAAWVRGDATRVKQILTNLLSNAVKYNVEGGRIHVSSRARDGMVELSVTDTGLGLSAEQMKDLFQPFNRLGRDRSSIEGTGIGLVISQRLAEWMGGGLWVQSTAGQGSSFTLTLPQVERLSSVHGELDEPVVTPSTYHRRRVHYVEDNETNVEVMRGILAQRPQIELSVSLTGLDGLAAIRTLRPDVILLDMHLPDISGMELLRHLRSENSTAGIPVIVVSADALQTQVEQALNQGALHYLTKPVNVSDLLSLLDDILTSTDTVFGDGII